MTTSPPLPRLVPLLSWAGIIPFAALAIYLVVPFGEPSYYRLVSTALAWWSVIILGFMAGSYWGMALTNGGDRVLMVASNVAAIAAWAALILLPADWTPVAVSALFALLLPLEWRACTKGLVPPSYLRLRMAITTAVVLCLTVLVMAQ